MRRWWVAGGLSALVWSGAAGAVGLGSWPIGHALSERVARAQSEVPPQALEPIQALAAQVEVRARTLSEADANDLPLSTVQSLANEIEQRLEVLTDAAAPYPTLARFIPDMRATMSALANAAVSGSTSSVGDAASTLLTQIADLRVNIRNMEGGFVYTD